MQSKDKNKESTTLAAESLASLSKQIEDICGRNRFPDLHAALAPLSRLGPVWASLDKSREAFIAQSQVMSSGLSNLLSLSSKWSSISLDSMASLSSSISHNLPDNIAVLAALESQTNLLAKNRGLSPITSIATQISKVSEVLSAQTAFVRELIAPTSLLSDLQSIATLTHQTIIKTGSISSWQRGVLDCASVLADRHIDWASQLYSSFSCEGLFAQPQDLCATPSRVNIVSILSEEIEKERRDRNDITINDAIENSKAFKLSEKGKKLIDKIVFINKWCERTGRELLFKYTGGTMVAAASMGGTICSTKEAFGDFIDGLYMIFYENLSRIKTIVTDETVRNDAIFECIFHVKNIRTDFRHDYEHGSVSEIRNKTISIGKSYSHYVGKPVLSMSDDYLTAQDKLFEEFDELTEYLISKVSTL